MNDRHEALNTPIQAEIRGKKCQFKRLTLGQIGELEAEFPRWSLFTEERSNILSLYGTPALLRLIEISLQPDGEMKAADFKALTFADSAKVGYTLADKQLELKAFTLADFCELERDFPNWSPYEPALSSIFAQYKTKAIKELLQRALLNDVADFSTWFDGLSISDLMHGVTAFIWDNLLGIDDAEQDSVYQRLIRLALLDIIGLKSAEDGAGEKKDPSSPTIGDTTSPESLIITTTPPPTSIT